MQAVKIEFGRCYAIRATNDRGFNSFKVESLISVKSQTGTVNKVSGHFETGPNAGAEKFTFEVSRLEGPVEAYAALMAEKRAKDDAIKAKSQAEQDAANEAGKLLAEKLGVDYGEDYKSPIRISRADITVHSEVLPALIAFLKAPSVNG